MQIADKNTIDLDSLQGLPIKYIHALDNSIKLITRRTSLEFLLKKPNISTIVQEIDFFCKQNLVIGYHYTKTNIENIKHQGLICRTGEEIRDSFLNNHRALFSNQELVKIKNAWQVQFNQTNANARDLKLYFNLTKYALGNQLSKDLLKYYGGEQIYKPLIPIKEIAQKIELLGEPLLLKCILDPRNLHFFIDKPFGKIALSTYLSQRYNSWERIDFDAYQRVNVKPQDINIIQLKNQNSL